MLYFFYGEEDFLLESDVRAVRGDFAVADDNAITISFDCTDGVTLGEIESALGAQSLFSPVQLVIIKDFFQSFPAQEQRFLKDSLEKRTGEDTIVFWENGMPRKNAALFTWLTKNADETKHRPKISGATLSSWIQDDARERDATFTSNAVGLLASGVGNNLQHLDHEIEKLSLYAMGREITTDDVELLVASKVDGDIFGAVGALTGKDISRRLTLLKTQILSGDDPHHVFSMYVYQVRTLLLVGSMYHDEGITNQKEIASRLKMHPFVVQKSLDVNRSISQTALKKMHKSLLDIDHAVKTGKRDMGTALEMFVVRA